MKRPLKFLLLFVGLLLGSSAKATTYYIAASGSDSNSGTSKSSPWAHAPGMKNCTAVCNSTTPGAGDFFIFRGGDTWTLAIIGSGTQPWTWTWAGGNTCNLDPGLGAINTTPCIYIGVDQTWFTGGSWSRPKMFMGNPPSTTRPSSCPVIDLSTFGLLWLRQPYVILDNFDWSGECWNTGTPSSPISGAVVTLFAQQQEVINNYFHGWLYGTGSTDDEFVQVAYAGCTVACIIQFNAFDGSDSSLAGTVQQPGGTGPFIGAASGKMLGVGTDVSFNMFYEVSNGAVFGANPNRIHDNTFAYMFEPVGGVHGNIVEAQGDGTDGAFFYNNLQYNTNEGEGNNLYCVPAGTASGACSAFNNISWFYRSEWNGSAFINSTSNNGANGFLWEEKVLSARTAKIFNNTIDNPYYGSLKDITAAQQYWGNHFIGYSPQTVAGFGSTSGIGGATGTNTDNGGQIFQTEFAANTQGYTASNNYAPTSGSGATVAHGISGTTLAGICSTIVDPVASAACLRPYQGITYNFTTHTVTANPVPSARPTGAALDDAGAYQFTTSSQVATPTFSPAGGTFLSAQNVTISDSTPAATICYTTDGSTPTANGAGTCTHGSTYSATVAVAISLTIKAVASESGFTDSAVGSAVFTINSALPNPGAAGAFMGAD